MPNDTSRRHIAYTVSKKSDGWFVASPDQAQLGPYHNAAFALGAAVIEVMSARRQAVDAHVVVQDEHGAVHRCMVIDRPDGPDRCPECECSWPARPGRLRCPVRAAIGVW
jgi:hypothetical protein